MLFSNFIFNLDIDLNNMISVLTTIKWLLIQNNFFLQKSNYYAWRNPDENFLQDIVTDFRHLFNGIINFCTFQHWVMKQ